MKKTTTINLGQSIFHIDEDAYELLRQYLDSLKNHFENEEGADEILEDIESRMSDLFKERIRYGLEVLTVRDAREVIEIMGHPEDFEKDGLEAGPENVGGHKEASDAPAQPSSEKSEEEILNTPYEKGPKRLFRDPDNQVLGGVSSGIGHYLNIDANIVRILFVIFAFLWGASVLLYLLMWIIIPEAKSSAQKLQMNGYAVTIDNIRHSILAEKKKGDGGSVSRKTRSALAVVLRVLLIIVITLIVVGIISALLLFLMPFGFGAMILSSLAWIFDEGALMAPHLPGMGIPDSLWPVISHSTPLIFGLLLVFGIPIVALIRFLIVSAVLEKPLSKAINWVLGISWLVGIVLLLYWTFSCLPVLLSNPVWHINVHWLQM